MIEQIIKIIYPLVSFQIKVTYTKVLCITKCIPFCDQIFSKTQCGFRVGFNTEQCSMHMVKKLPKCLDPGYHCCALLEDLSKAFDCIDH